MNAGMSGQTTGGHGCTAGQLISVAAHCGGGQGGIGGQFNVHGFGAGQTSGAHLSHQGQPIFLIILCLLINIFNRLTVGNSFS